MSNLQKRVAYLIFAIDFSDSVLKFELSKFDIFELKLNIEKFIGCIWSLQWKFKIYSSIHSLTCFYSEIGKSNEIYEQMRLPL